MRSKELTCNEKWKQEPYLNTGVQVCYNSIFQALVAMVYADWVDAEIKEFMIHLQEKQFVL